MVSSMFPGLWPGKLVSMPGGISHIIPPILLIRLDLEEHLFAFSFETAIWDFYIVPWLISHLLKNNPSGRIKLINAIKASIAKFAIIDRIFKKTGNSSCLVIVARKVRT